MLLAVEPVSLKFGPKKENDLLVELDRFDRSVEVAPVLSLDAVQLRADGTFDGKIRPTTWFLYQLCKSACSGLYQMLVELVSEETEERRLAAISIFNQAVRVSFSGKICGQQAIYDRDRGTAEALVGGDY